MNKDKLVIEITRERVEGLIAESLTDEQWEVLAGEIEGFLDYYLEEDTRRVWADGDFN
jgi:hypothetical protein